ncbi:MAG TPA: hypothetical protein PLV50_14280 [Smithella sp.]|nr:hypothetical protein [Smithella sp.]HOG91707.1 hypothetical protein [Smithella sp.]
MFSAQKYYGSGCKPEPTRKKTILLGFVQVATQRGQSGCLFIAPALLSTATAELKNKMK